MNIKLERIQTADHPYFALLFDLYRDSFPVEERRELSSLLTKFSEKSMCFSAIWCESELVGLLVYWVFGDFLYVEHLAIFPRKRGGGLGSNVLKILQEQGVPVLLEVEIPHDEPSLQRVAFYNRSGFRALHVEYFQPPYLEGESLLPMTLFSDHSEWETETLRNAIEFFHRKVYNSPMKGNCQ